MIRYHSTPLILLFIPFGNENAPLADLQQEGLPLKQNISDRRNPNDDRETLNLRTRRSPLGSLHDNQSAQIH